MIRQCNVRASAEDNPDTYFVFGGDIFAVTYPLEREQFDN
jgi:hypothetical protein